MDKDIRVIVIGIYGVMFMIGLNAIIFVSLMADVKDLLRKILANVTNQSTNNPITNNKGVNYL